MCQSCLELQTSERHHYAVFIAIFEQISGVSIAKFERVNVGWIDYDLSFMYWHGQLYDLLPPFTLL